MLKKTIFSIKYNDETKRDSRQIEFYENHFHKKGYDTIKWSEYLKNT